MFMRQTYLHSTTCSSQLLQRREVGSIQLHLLPLLTLNDCRFAYTDFSIGNTIAQLKQEGATSIGVFYDIYCHWVRNLELRIPNVLLPGGAWSLPEHFFGGIPKYHLAGHTDGCYARFSLNNMYGIGRLDAEGCERAWAEFNRAVASISQKGPGARIDWLNHMFQDWNWMKTIGMSRSQPPVYVNEQTNFWTNSCSYLEKMGRSCAYEP
jgi:hypothetical protein